MTISQATNFLEKISQQMSGLPEIDKLEMLIEMGERLPTPTHDIKTPSNHIAFCASDTYIQIDTSKHLVSIQAESGALITKGYLYIITTALSGLTLRQIVDSASLIEKFAQQTGINYSTIPSRSNAFSNFYEYIKTQLTQRAI